MYLNMSVSFCSKLAYKQKFYTEWVILSFALHKKNLKKSLDFFLFQWHWDFIPEFQSICWSEVGMHSPFKYFKLHWNMWDYDLDVMVTHYCCWQVIVVFMTNVVSLIFYVWRLVLQLDIFFSPQKNLVYFTDYLLKMQQWFPCLRHDLRWWSCG